MPNKTWKNLERKVATMLGGKRVPSSGAGAIKGDVQHDIYFIECKWGNQIPKWVTKQHEILKDFTIWFLPLIDTDVPQTILNWYYKARMQADGKIPLLVMKPKGVHNEFVFYEVADGFAFTTLKAFAEHHNKIHGGEK